VAQAPARPPASIDRPKALALFCCGSLHFITLLNKSFRASLRALFGNILQILIPFPFQREVTPSFLTTLLKQSVNPWY